MMSSVRVRRSRFLKAVVMNSCGMVRSSCNNRSVRSAFA
jgi:hypothetical protein